MTTCVQHLHVLVLRLRRDVFAVLNQNAKLIQNVRDAVKLLTSLSIWKLKHWSFGRPFQFKPQTVNNNKAALRPPVMRV